MKEIAANQVEIQDPFWAPRMKINAEKAIFHQWEMLESSGCINNFRIAAGEKEGARAGWFFADSDAVKWLDAAARIIRNHPDERLLKIMDDFIDLIGRAQNDDGYLFTYNQILFPRSCWSNLQIEHELYCHGHLIEAGVSHFEATGGSTLLRISERAADLLVRDFLHAGPDQTPGHEEVEIALLRLWKATGKREYFELAKHFLEERGKIRFFGIKLLRQFISNSGREKFAAQRRCDYFSSHPKDEIKETPEINQAKTNWLSTPRYLISGLSGKYFQQHQPVNRQTNPVGHAVRFGYLKTAEAMLLRDRPDAEMLKSLEMSWERMVTRRMDVTGGLGAVPVLEGFGRDYELDPELAYNETCAAIASLYWNWQMTLLTGKACYSDLLEWQLYNAVSVGMGVQGDCYFYNNPTLCRGKVTRQPWFSIPCCPSNLSRTYADLGRYLFSDDEQNLWVHQYIGSSMNEISSLLARITLESELPWSGKVKMTLSPKIEKPFTLRLRIPSWSRKFNLKVNGEWIDSGNSYESPEDQTACGYDPRKAYYIPILRKWGEGDQIEIDFDESIRVLFPHPQVRALRGRAAVSRGPLVYCLESVDNPTADILNCAVNESSLTVVPAPELFGGIQTIRGLSIIGENLVFVPYFLWGNRGQSKMTAWVKVH